MSVVALNLETVRSGPVLEPPSPASPGTRRRPWWRYGWLLLALWIASGLYIVAPDQQAVETMFGKVVAPNVMPGIHYALPWPIQSVDKLKVRQMQRLVVGGELTDGVLGKVARSQFLTGDQNIINLRIVVQYSVSVPADFLFRAQDQTAIVAAAVESEMARRVAHRGVDAVLTNEKTAVQEEVRAGAQKRLSGYRCGVQLSSISIEKASPPAEAADAFRDVASARADTSRIVSIAQGYANDLLPKARGEARQMTEESNAYKQRKINEAGGDASRFDQVAAEYAKAPSVTRQRLILETMEQVLPRIKKVIVEKNGNLDLTIIRKGEPK